MPTTIRNLSLGVSFNGNSLTGSGGFTAEPAGTGYTLSARGQITADTGWPTCSVFVSAKPASGEEDATLTVDAGAGNNVRRFTGVLREFRTSGFPKALELVGTGTLAYADDWAPSVDMIYDPSVPGWIEYPLAINPAPVGFFGVTDQVLVRGVLDVVPNITFTSGDIGGTGISLGEVAPLAFVWKAGTSAWRYIQQVDQVTRYRTYQDRNGAIKRVQMVGHPSGSPSFTLDDDDVLDTAQGSRDTTRTRNGVSVTGYDYGNAGGPISATAEGSFHGWETRWEYFASPMIEQSATVTLSGINADTLAAAVLTDVLKEYVNATVPTWRDDTCEPGQTILLDCLNRLAIGENMWVQGYAWEVTDNFTATLTLSGGGV
jgi:hypothetical protein